MPSSFQEKNIKRWIEIQHELFPGGIPTSSKWDSIPAMLRVLKKIGEKDLNHLFFPSGGGLDLLGAQTSHERDCIELIFSPKSATILRPKVLMFESFPAQLSMSYFRIEARTLDPSGVYENLLRPDEELLEVGPENYMERSFWDEGHVGHDEDGYEIPIPKHARVVHRYFGGSFVIFAKGSLYNDETSTYDARHDKMTAPEFRAYIERTVAKMRPRN